MVSGAYVKNKAGLTGQTVPGRRIPGHWPYPGPEELAETEPCVPGLIDVPFFVFLFNTPHERVLAKLGRHGRANFSMSRLRSAGSPARSCSRRWQRPNMRILRGQKG